MTSSVIQKIVVFVFFGIVASGCALEDDSSVTAKKDIAKPVLTEITAVTTPTNDTTPDYTFSSSEAGTITYGGSCSSITSSVSGNNTITLNTLSDGTYSDCTITVTDESGNVSSPLTITSFTIDTTTPTISEVTVVTNPTNDSTPNYTFSSSETGTITYGGSCSSSTTSATSGNNTITLNTLSEDNYSDCTITVTDEIGFVSSSLTISSFIVDLTSSTLVEVSAISNPTNDTTPDYIFSSSEAGTITYGGSCSSSTTSVTTDNNTITLNTLGDNTYSDCTITVTDNASNSVTLNISSFTIESVSPTVSSTSPENSDSLVLKSSNIDLVFSESMDNSSITTNTSNTSCSGTLQVSSDNFSSCIQMSSSPTPSNSNKTFTIWPSSNLSVGSTYKIRITTGVKDIAGNTLGSQYETSNGFTTSGLFFAVGAGTLLKSPDAKIWTGLSGGGNGIAYDNNTLVSVGNYLSISTSSNGTTWTERDTSGFTKWGWTVDSSGNSRDLNGVAYGNSIFVTVGSEGIIGTSSDGTSWTLRTSGTTVDLKGVGYGNGSFVAVGINATTLTSPDGITWTSRSAGSGSSDTLNGIVYGNSKFVIVGGIDRASIFETSDVTDSWGSTLDFPYWVGEKLFDVTYGNNTFVSVGYNGRILTSSDASTWTERSSGTTQILYGVTYGNGIFVAVGIWGSDILNSSDGITWTKSVIGYQKSLYKVIYTE